MTALTVQENSALAILPATLQVYVQVRFKKQIKDYAPAELEIAVHDLLYQVHLEMGQTKALENDNVINTIRDILMKDFRRRYATQTMEELRLYVSNGVRGDYGSFNGQLNVVNVQNFHYWIKKGLESYERKQAIAEFNKAFNSGMAKEPTKEEKLLASKESLLKLFEEYKATGNLGLCPWAYCGVLAELIGEEVEYLPGKFYKTFVTDPACRRRLELKAVAEYQKDMDIIIQKEDTSFSDCKRENKPSDVDKLMRAIITKGVKKEDAMANKKKEVALRWYFDRLISENKELVL